VSANPSLPNYQPNIGEAAISTEANKAIVRRLVEAFNAQDVTALDALAATSVFLYQAIAGSGCTARKERSKT
jgi:hypothetical protein